MSIAPSPVDPNWLDQIRPAMRDVASSGIVEVFNYGRGRQGLIPLWVGEGDLPTPPFISEAAKASLTAAKPSTPGSAACPNCARRSPPI